MHGEYKIMKMPSCSKKKLKDGMIKEFKRGNLMQVTKFYWKTLVLDFLQENFSLNGKDHTSSRKFIVLELSRLIMPRAQIQRWLMGQRIKYYISCTPINMETNIIQTITLEEHLRETFRNALKF